jgi:hypothetical protein
MGVCRHARSRPSWHRRLDRCATSHGAVKSLRRVCLADEHVAKAGRLSSEMPSVSELDKEGTV